MESRISRFLFKYRVTPQTTTGLSPAELLMGRRLRTHLDLLHPDMSHQIAEKQDKQKQSSSSATRKFLVNDRLYAKDFHRKNKWIPVTVTKVTGPLSYQLLTEDGIVIRRHVAHLRYRYPPDTPQEPSCDTEPEDDSAIT